MNESETIITVLRFHLSTSAPAKGPSSTWGSIATMLAKARVDARPVVLVIHQTRANWTSLLPKSENAWPAKMTMNGPMGRLELIG